MAWEPVGKYAFKQGPWHVSRSVTKDKSKYTVWFYNHMVPRHWDDPKDARDFIKWVEDNAPPVTKPLTREQMEVI